MQNMNLGIVSEVLMDVDAILLFFWKMNNLEWIFCSKIGIVCYNDNSICFMLFCYLCRIIYCVAANDVTQVRQQYGFTIKPGKYD